MKSSFVVVAATACLFSVSSFASGEKTDRLAAHLREARPKGKAEVLAALPTELKENFVLVKRSRSRQRGTPALPRLFHFTKNADLVVTSSGHDATRDRAANDLEIMEFDEKTGEWMFSTISFDESGLTGYEKRVQFCNNCHGDRPRPIWGDHLNWPTALGGSSGSSEETMTGDELAEWTAFVATQPLHEGYRHLKGNFSQDRFSLANTTFGKPNTVFTARLGVLTAEALFLVSRETPEWERNGSALSAAVLGCTLPPSLSERIARDYDTRLKNDPAFASRWNLSERPTTLVSIASRLVGLDPTGDFELELFPAQAERRADFDSATPWNAGADTLPDLFAFRYFHLAYQSDAALRAAFASEATAIDRIARDSFQVSNRRLAELDKSTTSHEYRDGLFPSLNTRVWKTAKLKRLACDALLKRAM